MKTLYLTACLGIAALGLASAQETSHFAFDIGGGFTTPVYNTGKHVDYGWNVGAGAGYNFNSRVGALIDVNYNSFGINSATLQNIGVPGGGLHVFSATLDPIIHLTPKSHFDLYVTGGGGLYHRMQDFTQPSSAVVSGYDPYLGFYPVTVPTTQVLGSYSVNKPGVDIGMGIALGSVWHGKFFAEAKYNRIFANYHSDYVPVTFGFRW